MKPAFLTAPVLILALLFQTATSVAATLPCPPEHLTAAATAAAAHADLSSHQSHQGHQPDMTQSESDDRASCCDDANPGVCTASGCAAGGATAMTLSRAASLPVPGRAAGARSLERPARYSAPPSDIFRPPIA